MPTSHQIGAAEQPSSTDVGIDPMECRRRHNEVERVVRRVEVLKHRKLQLDVDVGEMPSSKVDHRGARIDGRQHKSVPDKLASELTRAAPNLENAATALDTGG
jgi:hypothetical protein